MKQLFKVALEEDAPGLFNVIVTRDFGVIGFLLHCLFWFHTPIVVESAFDDSRLTCRDCLMKEYLRIKSLEENDAH